MLESFKRLFTVPGQGADVAEITAWAKKRGYRFAPMEQGFALDGEFEGQPWQLEWAPALRPFIRGHELRMQMQPGIHPDLHMMLMSAPLMKALEQQAYAQFTQNMQTQIDDSTPEEVRWLVMFAKVDLAAVPGVAAHFSAVANSPAKASLWIEGPLAKLLERATGTLMVGDPPFVMTVSRGRIAMRLELSDVASPFLSAAITLFETAAGQATD